MLAFLRSSVRFIGKVIKRSVAGIVWWLLDVSEIYTKIIAPQLPTEWVARVEPFANYLDVVTPWIVSLIVFGAILYTYYEVDKQVRRDPKVSKKLKEMYSASGELLRRAIPDDAQLTKLKQDCHYWFKEIKEWIEKNMEPPTLTRFMHFPHSLPYHHDKPLNDEHQRTINGVNIYHKNLQAIIDSQEWR